MPTVKLQSTTRTYRGKPVTQWSITLPKHDVVEMLGWQAGDLLSVTRLGGRSVLLQLDAAPPCDQTCSESHASREIEVEPTGARGQLELF